MKLSFSIPCDPPKATSQQKGAVRIGAGIRFYKKQPVVKAEKSLFALLQPHVPDVPFAGPLSLAVLWSFPWRKSETRKRRALGAVPCDVRPDLSNIVKLLEDTMTTLRFWNDDSQIAQLSLTKEWGDWAGIKISVMTLEEPKAKQPEVLEAVK